MKLIFISVLMLSIFSFSFLNKKQITIQGIVTDAATSLPIQGASVNVKGESRVVITDVHGGFTIAVSETARTLICSFIGYTQQEIKIKKDHQSMHIALKVSAKLEEVVVIGYSGSEADKESYPAPLSVLQGKTSGIVVGRGQLNKRMAFTPDPTFNTEDYDGIVENRFQETTVNPLSTFSIDVDGASYSNVRRFLQTGQLPATGAVRIEELLNYFHYDYPQPESGNPFSINTELGVCPWNKNHQLVMIGLQGKKIPVDDLPSSNLVFLIDVSGSMMDENKLPLIQSSMKLLTEQLREQDKVSIVVYAGNAGLVLPAISGSQKQQINHAIEALEAGGSTAGGEGIKLAYKVAKDNFIKGANNRVILCTDGDFNVGASSDADLIRMIEEERNSGIYLTVLGYGMGNYKDNKMQQLADKGNGNHAYIDNIQEAKKVLVNEFGGTLFTIAKDVKLQVEFNPKKVQGYRLVGYENRLLNKEDFNNDKKDAGDLGSGHTVTALYELIPAGIKDTFIEKTDPLKYQSTANHFYSGTDLMTIKFRYKQPDGNKSRLIEQSVSDNPTHLHRGSDNFRFAAAVAEFGMLLTNSEFKQGSDFPQIRSLAGGALGNDKEGYRVEFLQLVEKAHQLMKNESTSRIENIDAE
jgi:Ca-activated chloride channel family protein